MSKNQGPKKRARETARKLNVPLSEAKTRLTAAAKTREGRGLPGPITLKVAQALRGYEWDTATAPHAIITGPTGSGKTWLASYIARQAMRQGRPVIWGAAQHPHGVLGAAEGDAAGAEYYWADGQGLAARLAGLMRENREGAVVILDDFWAWDASVREAVAAIVAAGPGAGVSVVIIQQQRTSIPASIVEALDLWVAVGDLPTAWDTGIERLGHREAAHDDPEGRFRLRILTRTAATAERSVSFAANHAQNLTLATPSGRTRPTDRPVIAPVQILPDDEVQFYGDRFWWSVQAVGDRGTLVLTRKEAFGDGGVYTIVHWGRGWRGPHDSWGHPAVTREECQEVAAAIEAGEDILDMSVRNSVYLDLKRVRRGKLTLWADESA